MIHLILTNSSNYIKVTLYSKKKKKSISFENYNLVEEQMQMMDHFLHGIFTEKGREAYQEQQAKLS